MFTGIIEGTGRLLQKKSRGGGLVFRLTTDFELSEPQEGESIAINGSCLTVYNIEGRSFSVDISPESVSRTTLGNLNVGDRINMERALRMGDRLGGHIVSGHVDCTAEVVEIKVIGDFTVLSFLLAEKLSRYIIEKGSVTIDGVSLTVNQCDDERFSVSIIPHTLQTTTLGLLKKGSKVNIEVDIIGKYVEKLMAARSAEQQTVGREMSTGFLAEHGFF